MTCVTCEDYPEVTCPKCGCEFPDMDGFGFLFCAECGHCRHPSKTDGVCGICGETVPQDKALQIARGEDDKG